MSIAIQSCPRCGNENSGESYACSFCGKRLRIERIERIPFLKRIEEDWFNPYPLYLKILYLIINPSRAFWDINHLRKKSPGMLILLFNSLAWGLVHLIVISRLNIDRAGQVPSLGLNTLFNLSIFGFFFLFGFLLYLFIYSLLIWLYTKGANYAVGFTQKLEKRFDIVKGKKKEKQYEESKLSPFSIYKGGVLLQKQEASKFKMMLCAFTPFLIINLVKVLIVTIGFPMNQVDISIGPGALDIFFNTEIMNQPIWSVLDMLDALTLSLWVPILVTISIRELSNSSTYRVLTPIYIISIIASIFIFFLRPTLFG